MDTTDIRRHDAKLGLKLKCNAKATFSVISIVWDMYITMLKYRWKDRLTVDIYVQS